MNLNRGVPTFLAYCEKKSLGNISLIQPGYVPLDGLCLEFFRDFYYFLGGGGGLWGKSFIGNI